jgi:hypothetical protein
MSIVHVINRKTSKDKQIMNLLRKLVTRSLHYNIVFEAQHIQGLQNVIADKLSRKIDIKLLRERMQKYPIPSTCDKLCVPKVNLPVWKRLNRFVRTKDIRISNIQRICVAAEAALAGVLQSGDLSLLIADKLSRFQLQDLQILAPQLDENGTDI